MNSLKLSKKVIGIALSVLFVNAAFADATSDAHIQAYKSNKLIPENIVLPTSTNATDSQEVVAFSGGSLKWDSGTTSQLAINALAGKYDGWTMQELVAALGPVFDWNSWPYGWGDERNETSEEILQYLSLIANNKATSDQFTANDAKSQLQQALNDFSEMLLTTEYSCDVLFPCEGLDFTGLNLMYANLSNFTGLTPSQILSASSLNFVKLPAIAFNGTKDFSGQDLLGTDLSKCTGITGTQIASAYDISSIEITSAQYNEWKSELSTTFNGTYIYVDGVSTEIQ